MYLSHHMNKKIIEQFNLLIKQIQAEYLNARAENNIKEITTHKFRLQSTKKALVAIRNLDFEIIDISDISEIPGIGKGTVKRIEEILEKGVLSEIKNKYDKKKQTIINGIQELEKVIGIGGAIAKKMVTQHNIKNIKDLKKAIKNKKIKVNDAILLGLKYYGIVEVNIPRKEIMAIENFLIKEAHKIDSELDIIICGSYRRGKKTSGDIDVLIFHPNIKTMQHIKQPDKFKLDSYLELFINALTHKGFLLDNLTDKNYYMKYMGFSKYKNNPVRRIDIRFIPYKSLPTAMLYFTGPYELNTIMRIAAKKRDMILNEYGLYKIDENNIKTPIRIKSEEDVFEILGMGYLTPEERESFSDGKIKKKQ